MHLATINNNIEIVKLLLLSGKVNVNIQSISMHQIFSSYCKSNNLMQSKNIFLQIKFLLYLYFTPLFFAAEYNRIEIVKLLLSSPKINLNIKVIFKNHQIK